MTTKLARWSWVLALPLSAVLAAPAERAVEVPLNSTGKTATKSITTPKDGTTATRKVTVNERSLSMRDVAPARADDDPTIYHSIHDWVPRAATKTSHTQTQSTAGRSGDRARAGAARERAVEVHSVKP